MTVEELQIIISAKTEAVQSKIAKVKEKIASLQPKKAANVDVTTNKAQGNLKKLQSEIDRTQAKINKLKEKMAGVYAKQDAIASKYTGLPNLTGMTKDQSFDYMVGQDPEMQALNAQLDKLDAQAAPLKAHLAEVKEQIAAAGNAAGPAATETRALSESMKNASGNMQKAGKSGGFFGRRIKSVLLGMMLYRGVSFIFQSISEGFQNMAQGNAQANSTMSQLASSALYLKNSIAAALMPALQALTPIIVQVADAISWAANKIAIFIAQVSGQKTVTIAKKTNVDYAKSLNQTGSSASNANKKIKELQRTVMGFDELNVLNKNVNNTLASSPKSSTPDYGSMFQTIKTPTANWEKAKNKVYKFFDTLKDKTDKAKTQFKGLTSSAKEFVKALNPSFVPVSVAAPALGLQAFNNSKKKYQAPIKAPDFVPVSIAAPAIALADFLNSKKTYQAPIAAPDFVPVSIAAPAIALADFLNSKKTYQAPIKAPTIEPLTVPAVILTSFFTSLELAKQNVKIHTKSVTTAFATAGNNVMKNARITFSYIPVAVAYGLNAAGKGVSGWLTSASKGFANFGTNIVSNIGKTMSSWYSNFIGCLSAAWNQFTGFMSGVGKSIGNWWNANKSWAAPAAIGLAAVGITVATVATGGAAAPAYALLATGGLITGPTYAMVGEGKDNEAVLPLNSDVYSQIANGIAKNNNSNSMSDEGLETLKDIYGILEQGHSINLKLDVDGRPFVNKVIKEMGNRDRRYHPQKAGS